MPGPGYQHLGWTLSGAECRSAATSTICQLPADALAGDASARVAFTPIIRTLTVAAGPGGSVEVSIGGGSTATVAAGARSPFGVTVETPATLTAMSADHYDFAGWSGGCAPAAPACRFGAGDFVGDRSASAHFTPTTYQLTVSVGENGFLSVDIVGEGLSASVDLAAGAGRQFPVNIETAVTLEAGPDDGYRTVWGGDCAGTMGGACEIPALGAGASASAAFEAIAATLALALAAGANGSVDVSAGGTSETVAAGGAVERPVTVEDGVLLEAMPEDGYRAMWGGDCGLAQGDACEPPAAAFGDGRVEVTLRFEPVPTTLAVAAETGGSVAVSIGAADPVTVAAGMPVEFDVDVEASATLMAITTGGYTFTSWEGDCADAADAPVCEFADAAFDGAISATARFAPIGYTLAVTAGANGSVVVSAGGTSETVAADSSRRFTVDIETQATLTAEPDPGYGFAGWSGDCAAPGPGSEVCRFGAGDIDGDRSAGAGFRRADYSLTVILGPVGSVAAAVGGGEPVTVSGAGAHEFGDVLNVETALTLTATPDPGWRFAGWLGVSCPRAGAAGGAGVCGFDAGEIIGDVRASADFAPIGYTLSASAGEGGSVEVTVGDEVAVTVGAESSVDRGFTVEALPRLVARPAAGHLFSHWTGACAGQAADCLVPLGAATGAGAGTVSAQAVFGRELAVSALRGGSVDVTVGGAALPPVAAGETETFPVVAGDAVALEAVADAHYMFGAWEGDACAAASANPCEIAPGALAPGSSAAARFAPVDYTLAVEAGEGGSVGVEIGGEAAGTVAAGTSRGFTVNVATPATLTAAAAESFTFAGWDELGACARVDVPVCGLEAGSLVADSAAAASFAPVARTLTVEAGPGGSVGVSVGGVAGTVAAEGSKGFPVIAGRESTLTAAPADGYAFAGWSGDACAGDRSDGPVCTIPDGAISANTSVTAAFEPVRATLALALAAGANGSVDVSAGGTSETVAAGGAVERPVTVEDGVLLEAMPEDGYRAMWGGDCGLAQGDACEPPAAAFGDGRVEVTLRFEPVRATLALALAAGANGSVDVSAGGTSETVAAGGAVERPVTVEDGVLLEAMPEDGYRAMWGGDCGLAQGDACEPPAAAFGDGRVEVTLRFEPVRATLALALAAGANGSVDVSAGGTSETVAAGGAVERPVTVEDGVLLEAMPEDGYRAMWGGDCGLAQGDACEPPAAAFGDGRVEVTLRFEPVRATLALALAAGANGSVDVSAGGTSETVAAGGAVERPVTVEDGVLLEAMPEDGYRAMWGGDCGLAQGDACEPPAAAFGDGRVEVTLRFEPVRATLALALAAGANGSVDVSAGGTSETVAAGGAVERPVTVEDGVLLEAMPEDGYRAMWGGDCGLAQGDACEPPAAAFGDGRVEVTLRFEPVRATLALALAAGANGSVDVSAGGTSETVAAGGAVERPVTVEDGVLLEAMPEDGYRAMWGGDCGLAQGDACEPPAAAFGDGRVEVTLRFEPVRATLALALAAGANGSVDVSAGGTSETVAAGGAVERPVTVEDGVLLEAMPEDGYRAMWGGDCGLAQGDACEPPAAAFGDGRVEVTLRFEPVRATLALALAAGANGSVDVSAGGTSETVAAGGAVERPVTVEDGVLLEAMPEDGYRAMWGGDCGLAQGDACEPPAAAFGDGRVEVTLRFEPVRATLALALAAGANGSVDVSAGGTSETVAAGGAVERPVTVEDGVLLEAMPEDGYRAMWGGDCGLAQGDACEPPAAAFGDGRVEVTLRFEPVRATLALALAAGANGSVDVSAGGTSETVAAGGAVERPVTVEDGVLLEAMPEDGYRAMWGGDCGLAQGDACEPPAAAFGDGRVEVTLRFEPVRATLALALAAGANGSVDVSAGGTSETVAAGGAVERPVTVEDGVLLEAMPEDGYRAMWGGDCGLAQGDACEPPAAAFGDGRVEVTLRFEPVRATLALALAAGANGSVDVSAGGTSETVAAGGAVERPVTVEDGVLLEAMPEDGYRAMWGGDCGLAQGDACEPPAAAFGDGRVEVTLRFEPVRATLALALAAGANGSVDVSAGGTSETVAAGGAVERPVTVEDGVLLEAMPEDGYRAMWGGDCGLAQGDACEPPAAAFGDGRVEVTLRFEPVRATLALALAAGANGSVDVSAGGTSETVAAGGAVERPVTVEDGVLLEAMPEDGYRAMWGGDCGLAQGDACEPPAAAFGDGRVEVTLRFEPVRATLALALAAGANGSVDVSAGGTSETVAAGGAVERPVTVEDGVLLEAMPEDGYRAMWGGDCGLAQGDACEPPAAAFGDGRVEVTLRFEPVRATLALALAAGANGSVDVSAGGTSETVAAGGAVERPVTVEDGVLLEAMPEDGYRAMWGGDCGLAQGDACEPPAAAFGDGRVEVTLRFEPVRATLALALAAGANGSVDVSAGGTSETVAAGGAVERPVTVEDGVLLEAMPEDGYRAMWGGDCGLAQGDACEPPAAAFGDGRVEVTLRFEPVRATLALALAAGANGSVDVSAGGTSETVAAGGAVERPVTVEDGVLLEAMPEDGYRAMWGGDCGLAQGDACEPPAAAFGDGRVEVTLRFEPVPTTLAVAAETGGSVAVSIGAADPVTVAAGMPVEFDVDVEASATLMAITTGGYTFTSWEGDCADAADAPVCEFADAAFDGAISATARFAPIGYTLAVTAGANGSVVVSAGGTSETVAADSSRRFTVDIETQATLTAEPDPGYGFAGWSGDCAAPGPGSEVCRFGAGDIDGDRSAGAGFRRADYSLTVILGPVGSVAAAVGGGEPVTVSGAGAHEFGDVLNVETALTLTATPDPGWRFAGWLGVSCPRAGAAGGAGVCGFDAGEIIGDVRASADFAPIGYTLSASAGEGGSVEVTVGDEVAVTVGAESSVDRGFTVEALPRLVARPAAGHLFSHWTGACAGQAADCLVPLGAATGAGAGTVSAQAVFGRELAVSALRGGSVDVTVGGAALPPVAAGETETFPVVAGDAVALEAVADAHYMFGAWEGDACAAASANPCEIAPGALAPGSSAAARFAPVDYTLAVEAGEGGSVGVEIGGEAAGTVAAGTSRGFTVNVATPATLTAAAAESFTFAGWDELGACARVDVPVCGLEAGSLVADSAAAASFAPVARTLTVEAGPGGSVGVSVGGVAGTVAAEGSKGFPVIAGRESTLTAAPADGYAFAGWSGDACAGDRSDGPVCTIPDGAISANTSVTAAFEPVRATLALALAAGANGSVDVSAGGTSETVAAGGAVERPVTVEDGVLLEAMPEDGYRAMWGGDCGLAQGDACEPPAAAFGDGRVEVTLRFEPVRATLALALAAGANGSVDVSAGGTSETVAAGGAVERPVTVEDGVLLEAMPEDGYRAMWGGDCGLAQGDACEPPAAAFGDGRVEVTLRFEPVRATLALALAAGANGSVDVSAGGTSETVAAGGAVERPVTVEDGVLLEAMPEDGYRAMWGGDCGLAQGDACEPPAAAFGDGRVEVTLRFEPVRATLALALAAGANGSVDVSAGGTSETVAAGGAVERPVTVEDGVLLEAMPEDGYRAMWGGDCGLAQGDACEPPAAAFGDGRVEVTLRFEPVRATLALALAAGANGSVDVSAGGTSETVAAGGAVERPVTVEDGVLLEAMPEDGYRAMWGGDCGLAQGDACEPPAAAFGDGRVEVTLRFEPVRATLALALAAGANGSVDVSAGGTSETVAAGGAVERPVTVEDGVLLEAMPEDGYRAMWGGDCGLAQGDACEPPAAAFGDGRVEVTLRFEPVRATLALALAAGANGSVDVSAGGTSETVAAGGAVERPVTVEDGVLLEAMPEDGYRAMWGGDCGLAQGDACEPPAAAFGDGRVEVTLRFEPVRATLALALAAGANGSVDVSAGGTSETVAAGGAVERPVTVEDGVLLEAMPEDGYRAMWGGDCGLAQGDACEPPAAAFGDGRVEVTLRFEPVRATLALALAAGANGSVDVSAGGTSETVAAGGAVERPVTVEDGVLLEAMPEDGYRAMWGGDCGLAQGDACEPPAAAFGDGRVEVTLRFEPVRATLALALAAGANGSVDVSAGGTSETVAAGGAVERPVTVEDGVLLEAMPEDGYRAMWGGDCGLAQGDACEPPAAAFGDGRVEVTLRFEPVRATLALALAAGANGSVDVSAAGTSETVAAGGAVERPVTVEDGVLLEAMPEDGYRAMWGGDCGLAQGDACEPPAAAFGDGRVEVTLRFEPVRATLALALAAGANGSVDVSAGGTSETVAAGGAVERPVTVEDGVLLEAMPEDGYRAMWGGDCGLAQGDACEPPAAAFGDGRVEVTLRFEPVRATLALALAAGANGSVDVSAGGTSETVAAGGAVERPVTVEDGVLLEAMPEDGYRAMWGGDCGLAQGDACEPPAAAFGDGRVEVTLRFEPVGYTLSASAGEGGSVEVTVGDEVAVTVGAESSVDRGFTVEALPRLVARPAAGHLFSHWTGACAGQAADCLVPLGAATGAGAGTVSAQAVFGRELAVSALRGGSVDVTVGGAALPPVAAGETETFPVVAGDAVALEAVADAHYMFGAWEGDACAAASANPCEIAPGALAPGSSAAARFAPVDYTLAVEAGEGGSVGVEIGGEAAGTVAAGTSRGFTVNVATPATLTAAAAESFTFAGWDELGACARVDVPVCGLEAGSLVADRAAAASFEAAPATLTVTAGPGGSVAVSAAGTSETVAEDSTGVFVIAEGVSATLTAVPRAFHLLVRWTGACALAGTVCELPADVFGALPVLAAAEFVEFTWTGPGGVLEGDQTLIATPHAPGAFIGWRGGPCDGSDETDCDIASLSENVDMLVAEFRPFVVNGIKSLSFGLGYRDASAHHFRITLAEAPNAGFRTVLDDIASGDMAVELPVAVHLLAWDVGAYRTEACSSEGDCAAVDGGQRVLEQADSIAATGYFKAHNANADAGFGAAAALSGDGFALAVGSPLQGSGDTPSGAAYVYRRSSGGWAFETFVKVLASERARFGASVALSDAGDRLAVGAPAQSAFLGSAYVYRRVSSATWMSEAVVEVPFPNAGGSFGRSIALSADGATLAAGARFENSSATGAVHPDDPGYQEALDNFGAARSGAAYVYRRSSTDSWALEAFVKPPVVGDVEDDFGWSVALSADGSTLAVGARFEDSSATGALHPGDPGYQDALGNAAADASGAAYVYRRSSSSRWTIEAFVKAPNAGAGDQFGIAVALSADGATLAVGASGEGSAQTGALHPDDPGYRDALGSDGAQDSGAVYVYHRSASDRWTSGSFIKPSVYAGGDNFGLAVALSADGAMLAVGAPYEDSSATGAFAPAGAGRRRALGDAGALDSGAVYVYHRSASDRWTSGNFVKAPASGEHDSLGGDLFGSAAALSTDGSTLALGAPQQDRVGQSQPIRAGDELFDTAGQLPDSGAAYLY